MPLNCGSLMGIMALALNNKNCDMVTQISSIMKLFTQILLPEILITVYSQ